MLPTYQRTGSVLSQVAGNEPTPSLSVFEAFVAQHINHKPAKPTHAQTTTAAGLPHVSKLPKHRQKPSLALSHTSTQVPSAVERRHSTYSTDTHLSLADARAASNTTSMDSIHASTVAERQRHMRRQSALSQYSVALSEFDDASEQLPIAEQYWPALAGPAGSDVVSAAHKPPAARKASLATTQQVRQPPANPTARRQSVTGISSSNYNQSFAPLSTDKQPTAISTTTNAQPTATSKQATATPVQYLDPAYADLSTDGTFYFHSTLSLHMPSLVIDVSGLMGDDAGVLDSKSEDSENGTKAKTATTHKWSKTKQHEVSALKAIAPAVRHQRTVSQVYNDIIRAKQGKRNESAAECVCPMTC